MSEVFLKRKQEFIDYLYKNKKLPRVWEEQFSDRTDMRLWFDSIVALQEYKEYFNELSNILNNLGIKVLNSEEKEIEFINYINNNKKIPFYNNSYFSDNSDMYNWYISYIKINKSFERQIYNILPEYQEFDLAEVWSDIKDEFINIIKKLKIIPNFREYKVSRDIDVCVIFYKAQSLFPEIAEDLIYNITYNPIKDEERRKQYLNFVSLNEYRPDLQECRFSDGIDMFTWYNRIKGLYPEFDKQINKLDMYFIPEENSDNKKL